MGDRVRRFVLPIVIAAFFLLTAFLPSEARAIEPTATVPVTGDEDASLSYVNAPPAVNQYTVTLITGDTLYITRQDKGPWAVAIKAAPRPFGAVPFETYIDDQQGTFVVPADVISLVPRVLDPTFFNIDYLVNNGLTDDRMPAIAAIAQYTSTAAAAPWDPSMVATSDLPLIHGQALAVAKGRAADFGSIFLGHDAGWSLPGVEKLWLDRVVKADLDQSVPLIGGDIARNVLGFNGTGIKIAILDTGIDATHPDFFFPNGTSKVLVNLDLTCSVEPIIDVFCDKTPNDLFGHGTHVASIAAGTGAASGGRFVGVAPGAFLLNIKVLNRFGFGFFSWVIKGMEVATLGTDNIRGNEPNKEADVISMSLGGGPTDGTDPASQAVNTLVKTFGVTMVVAAGNFGSYFGVANPGAATQAITVAASTKVGSPIISEISPTSQGFQGALMDFSPLIPSGGITAPVVFAGLGDTSDFATIDAHGKIALMQRGIFFFRTKALNAAAAGAVAAIIFNNRPGSFQGTLISPGVPIPVISMSQEDGLKLKTDVVAGPTTVKLFNGPPAIASFSSRGPRVGPSPLEANFDIKPDISAPGVSIVAACSSTASVISCPGNQKYTTLSGTSMATPHVSGSVALILQQAKAAGVTLTPAQVKDVLQSTSQVLTPALPGKPDIDIYTQGAGLVKVNQALTSDVILSPAEMSFGVVTFDTTSLTTTFDVINRGSSTRSISLSREMRDVPTGLSPLSTGASLDSLVSLDTTALTLAPGAKATVRLTIDVASAPTQKLWSIFSGRVLARDTSGELAHAIVGFTKEGRRQVLNVAGLLPDGSPAAFQSFTFFDAMDRFGILEFFHSFDPTGHSTLRLPLSTYNLVMHLVVFKVISLRPFRFQLQLFRISALEVPVVESPASSVLDASTAGAVQLDLQADPAATGGFQQDDFFVYQRPDGTSVGFLSAILGRNWDLFAVNTDTAKLGTLWLHDRWIRVRGPGPTSNVLFDLTFTRTQTQQPTVHTVTRDDLVGTTGEAIAAIHSDTPGIKRFGRFSFPTKFSFPFAITGFYPVRGPMVRHEFQQASDDVFRQFVVPGPGIFWFDTPFTTSYFGFTIMGKVWAPGESLAEGWIEQPVHPSLTFAARSGSTLTISGHEIVDSFGHFGLFVPFQGAKFALLISVNGGAPTFFPFPAASLALPPAPAKVEVVMLMSPDPLWSVLAKTTATRISLTTSPTAQGPLALPTANYHIDGLNLLNQIPNQGSVTPIGFNIDLTAPTGVAMGIQTAAVDLSLDDGVTFFPASAVGVGPTGLVVQALIPTTGPGPFFISVRVHVVTTDGTAFDQMITRAMHIEDQAQGGD